MRAIILMLSLSGCGIRATAPPGQVTICKDLRNGETFTIHSENVSNAIVGADTCFDAIDDIGRKHVNICSDQQSFLKCEAQVK